MSKFSFNLNDREWGEFNFIDIFVIRSGFYNKKPPLEENGTIPFLGATDSNNGITEFYSLENIERNSKIGYGKNEPLSQKIFDGNCICVTNNGSVGYAYYQAIPFTCSHDVNPLYLKNHQLNKFIARFLISAIEKQRVCFQYSRKWRPIRMKKSKIKLPITQSGEPDYAFMENFIKERMYQKLKQYNDYLDQQIAQFAFSGSLKEKQWGEFFITGEQIEILNLKASKSGIDKNKLIFSDKIKDIPYITRTDLNNGYSLFIGRTQQDKYKIDKGNVITIGLDTQTAFYQPHSFFTGQNIQVLSSDKLNKFIALFLVRILSIQLQKFNWGGNGATLGRLARTKILLPITQNGEPDYAFMENYTCNLMLKKYKKYAQLRLQEYA
ncbi:MAG: restriction endonuclease subunit S [Neisseriaceae bacterium]|nr:restriction endonuclease subunit S [Neisseriaceae bacterium]